MSVLENRIGPFWVAGMSKAGGREANEDRHDSWCAEDGSFGCWVVADGLGGHRGGEIASSLAAKAIAEYFKRYRNFSPEAILHAFGLAQDAILHKQKEELELASMRTTAVVLLIEGRFALWGHVGDSRLYHFREDNWLFQTRDHSVTQAFYDAGRISTEEIRTDENRSRLTRVLGKDEPVQPEVLKKPIELTAKDSLLLCTDGLWEHMDDGLMKSDLGDTWAVSPQEWLERLEKRLLCTAEGEFDNYTACAVFFRPPQGNTSVSKLATESTKAKPMRGKYPTKSNRRPAGILALLGILLFALATLAYYILPPGYSPLNPDGSAQPLEAVEDIVETSAGTPIEIAVLENDGPGQRLRLAAVGTPRNGTVVRLENDSLRYTPEEDFAGRDFFSYEVTDGERFELGSVEVRVKAPPGSKTQPDPEDDVSATEHGKPVTIQVLGNDFDADGDELEINQLEPPESGTAVLEPEGSVTYTPDTDFEGIDQFRYEVSDGELTAWATVTVTVTAPNQPPQANDDEAETEAGKAVKVNVLENDTDPDGGPAPLVVTRIEVTKGGTAIPGSDGKSVVFTPGAGFSGEASFFYVITDGQLEAKAEVKIQVAPRWAAPSPPPPQNQPPVAEPDEIRTVDLRLEIKALENDTDPEGKQLMLESVTQSAHGRAEIQGDVVVYQRDPTFKGSDRFTYVVSDGELETKGTVTINVVAVLKPGYVALSSHGLSYVWIPAEEEEGIDAFWLGKTEVTVEAYKRFVSSRDLSMPSQGDAPGSDSHPAVQVSWSDAKRFCEELGGRLPTQEEWRYAVSGGRDQKYPWGDSAPSCTRGAEDGANIKKCGHGSALPVSSFGKNELKLTDMIGNVWEWCDGNVALGGGFLSPIRKLDNVEEKNGDKGYRDVGFRCARDAAPR